MSDHHRHHGALTGPQTPLAFGAPAPAYRLPPALQLGAVHLQVRSAERSIAYYRDVLGLCVLSEQTDTVAMGAKGGAPLVMLHERADAAPVPPQGRLGLFHFALLLPDRASLGRLLAHLVARNIPAGMSDHLVSEALYLTDPDGLGIEVYADRPRAEWGASHGQIAMGTAPLDMPALIAEGGGAPWAGAPAGTRMGHVHLHVGDLMQAEQFYHRTLGFDKTNWSYPGALFLSVGGYHHHLGTNTWARRAEPAYESEARLLAWTIVLPSSVDVQEAATHLASAEVPLAHHEKNAFSVRDPWNTSVTIQSTSG